jgi:hypothetical protein
VLAYLRPGRAAGESLIVLLNYGAEPLKVSLAPGAGIGGRMQDVLNGETLTVAAKTPTVTLPAFGARVLRAVHDPRAVSQAP